MWPRRRPRPPVPRCFAIARASVLLLALAPLAMGAAPGDCPHHDASAGPTGAHAHTAAHHGDQGADDDSEPPAPCRCASACHVSTFVAVPVAWPPSLAAGPAVAFRARLVADPSPVPSRYLLPLPNAPPAIPRG